MIIAGLQKTSLIDYPGKVCCVVFLTGCNFSCPFCHNPALACGEFPRRIEYESLMAFLSERRAFLDGVAISGGEPTLQPGLPELCRSIRQLGLAVKLDTNGSRPQVLAGLIEQGLVDYIAMDIKTDPTRYNHPLCAKKDAAGISESIRLIMAGRLTYEFRTTCVRPFVDEHIVQRIGAAIQGAQHYILQTFQPRTLLDPAYCKDRHAGFNPREMAALKAAAAPWVRTCHIR